VGRGGGLEVVADLAECSRGSLNDMVVDGAGQAFIGDIGFDVHGGEQPRPTSLKRVDPDGTVTVVADDLSCPNGAVVTPGNVLIVGESFRGRYTAFDIEADGSLAGRRTWVQLAETATPDGCCLDLGEHLWVAEASTRRCIRVAPNGEITDEIAAPQGENIFACMLGGEDGRSLLLCMAPDPIAAKRASTHQATLVTITVEVPRSGYP
jgi:sugar lactone lactonase YvrE